MSNSIQKSTPNQMLIAIDPQFKVMCREVQKLTQWNAHTSARCKIAAFFKYNDLRKVFLAIDKIHDYENSLPQSISIYRTEKTKEMMARIEYEFSTEIKNIVHSNL